MGIRPCTTIMVPANGTTVTGPTLEEGVTYQLTASGTVFLGTSSGIQIFADAEYAFGSFPTSTACGVPFDPIDIGISINNPIPDVIGTKIPNSWGNFDDITHTYTTTFVGTGDPITFTYWDCVSEDNEGFITIDICRLS